MSLTKEQAQELEMNGMREGSVGRFFYDEMIKKGLSHKEAVRNFVDGLNNMKSDSFDIDQLRIIKSIIGQIKGTIY